MELPSATRLHSLRDLRLCCSSPSWPAMFLLGAPCASIRWMCCEANSHLVGGASNWRRNRRRRVVLEPIDCRSDDGATELFVHMDRTIWVDVRKSKRRLQLM